MLTPRLIDVVEYEIASSWWAGWISNDWLQNKIAKYYIRKGRKKLERYNKYIKLKYGK